MDSLDDYAVELDAGWMTLYSLGENDPILFDCTKIVIFEDSWELEISEISWLS